MGYNDIGACVAAVCPTNGFIALPSMSGSSVINVSNSNLFSSGDIIKIGAGTSNEETGEIE